MEQELETLTETPVQQPAPARIFGHLVSIVLHPLFIPGYIAAYLIFIDPYAFASLPPRGKVFKLISVVFSTCFLPLFGVALMKQLGFVQSIFLRTQRDRVIPYIVSMIFFFWAWYVSRNLHDDVAMTAMLLSVFLCCIAGMMANIYYKVSMHTMAAGSFLVFFIWLAFRGAVNGNLNMSAATIGAGMVCTARMIVSDHRPFDIYSGLLIGGGCQLIAILFTA